jgi:hypothetical protein
LKLQPGNIGRKEVIQWGLQTKRCSALTVVSPLPLLLRSRSFLLTRDILMSPSAVQLAAQRREPSATALVAMVLTDLNIKCILRYVLSVVKNVKYPSSLERVGQYIAETVTGRSG